MMPMSLQVTRTVPCAAIAAFTLLFAATLSVAQEPASPQIGLQPDVESLIGDDSTGDAASQCASETAISWLSPYTFHSTKSGSNVPYNGCLVGGRPPLSKS